MDPSTESTSLSWWGIIITIIVILIVVVVATIVVWNRQAEREAHRRTTALDLSSEDDFLITPQIELKHKKEGDTVTLSQEDLALFLYTTFKVAIPAELVQLTSWDVKTSVGLSYNSRTYSEEHDYVWDLRNHLGLPLMVVVKHQPSETELPPPDGLAMARLHHLITNNLVAKANSLLNEMAGHRLDMLNEVIKVTGWNGVNSIVGGYLWVPKLGDPQIFRSNTYPEGVVGHPVDTAYRVNMLCSTEDFDHFIAIYKAHYLEGRGSSSNLPSQVL